MPISPGLPTIKRWAQRFHAGNPSPAAHGSEERGFLGWAEYLLKLATAAVGLVAAIGLPAMAVQLARFDVPLSTATYQDILRAGTLPAGALLIVSMYCFAAGKALRTIGLRQFLALHGLLLLPLLVIAYLLVLAGLLSYLLVIVWGVLWLLREWHSLDLLFNVPPSNRELLIISATIVSIGGASFLALKWAERHWLSRPGRFAEFLRRRKAYDSRSQSQASPAITNATGSGPNQAESGSKLRDNWWVILVLGLLVTLMLYCIKWLVWIWEPELGDAVAHRHVLYASAGSLAVFGLFAASIYFGASGHLGGRATAVQKRTVIGLAVVAFLALEIVFCGWGYPRIYSGLGGGRPHAATLWLKHDDDGKDITSVLTHVQMTSAGALKRVDNAFIMLDRQTDLLLTDSQLGPGKAVLISKARLMGVSW